MLKKKFNKGLTETGFILSLSVFIGFMTLMGILSLNEFNEGATIINGANFNSTDFNTTIDTTDTGFLSAFDLTTLQAFFSLSSPYLWLTLILVIPSLILLTYIILRIVRGV